VREVFAKTRLKVVSSMFNIAVVPGDTGVAMFGVAKRRRNPKPFVAEQATTPSGCSFLLGARQLQYAATWICFVPHRRPRPKSGGWWKAERGKKVLRPATPSAWSLTPRKRGALSRFDKRRLGSICSRRSFDDLCTGCSDSPSFRRERERAGCALRRRALRTFY